MELSLERMSVKLEKHLLGTAWGYSDLPCNCSGLINSQHTKKDCSLSWWTASHQSPKSCCPVAGGILPSV